MNDHATDSIGPSQQHCSSLHIPCLNKLANPRRTHHGSFNHDRSDGMNLKSVLSAELDEIGNPTGPPLPKRKMLSDKKFSQSELLVEDTTGKLLGCHRGKGWGKFQQDDFIDPSGLETNQLFLWTGQVSKIDLRGENFHRMRLEREHERRPLRFSSALYHGL
jgi:hypothetical protein